MTFFSGSRYAVQTIGYDAGMDGDVSVAAAVVSRAEPLFVTRRLKPL